MKVCAIDIETDDLDGKVLHLVCTKDVDTGEEMTFPHGEGLNDFIPDVDLWVAHNGLDFDIPVLARHGIRINPRRVVDTLVVSRLLDFLRDGGHSLGAWGETVGLPKLPHKDFSELTEEMLTYCRRDVDITVKLWHHFKPHIFDPDLKSALRVEHDMQIICADMSRNGFKFDIKGARAMLAEIEAEMAALEAEFQEIWPPQLVEVNRVQYRVKKDGTEFASVTKARDSYPLVQVYGDELVCYDYQAFDPASVKQRIDKLWEAGWKPVEKTDGHKRFLREMKG